MVGLALKQTASSEFFNVGVCLFARWLDWTLSSHEMKTLLAQSHAS